METATNALVRLKEAVLLLNAEHGNKDAKTLERLLAHYRQTPDAERRPLDPEDVRLLSQLHAQRVALLRLSRGLPLSVDLFNAATLRYGASCDPAAPAATASTSSPSSCLHGAPQPRKV